MRFGIMTMQKDSLIPSALPPGGIEAYLGAFDHAAIAVKLAGLGFSPIELGGDMSLFFPGAFSPPTIERLAALQAEQGISYTVHLPLWSTEPSSPLQPVRQGSVQAVVEVLRATLPLQPEVYVLHATGPLAAEFDTMDLPAPARALLMRLFQQQAGRSIGEILALTGLPSRRLAIETIEFPLDLTLELAEKLDLSICLDAGHILAGFSGPASFFEALERCLPRLAEIHLHDCPAWKGGRRLYGQDHAPLGTGDLDVAGLLDRLAAAHYAGPLVFELRIEEALASLERVRALRPGAVAVR
jgi:sugar phosphate isomerase/epimerase